MTVEIIVGDAIAELRKLPADSVDMACTSPPYWGLRDYGVAGQMGLEPTLGEHLDVMVAVFEEVRRVLKPHGSLWLNYGDCYAPAPNGRSAADTKAEGVDDRTFRDKPFSTVGPVYGAKPGQPNQAANGTGRRGGGNAPAGAVYVPEYEKTERSGASENRGNLAGSHGGRIIAGGFLKPKDLCMIPNRLAIALQEAGAVDLGAMRAIRKMCDRLIAAYEFWDDVPAPVRREIDALEAEYLSAKGSGWWVRSEIVWGKPNAMPDSSGAYRPSVSHEKIWLLTKSGDADIWRARDSGALSFDPDLTERCPLVTKPDEDGPRWAKLGSYYDAGAVAMPAADSSVARWAQDVDAQQGSTRANAGRKTNGNLKAFGGPRRSSTRVGPRHSDHVDTNHRGLDTLGRGEGRLLRSYERDLSPIVPPEVWDIATASFRDAHFATFPPALVAPCILAGCPKGGTVLDPFGGAGTTGLVADRLGRDAILIELNPAYAEMARERLRARFVAVTSTLPISAKLHGPLFDEVAA